MPQSIQSQESSRTNGTFSNPKNPSSDNEKDELGALNIFARDDILIVSNPKNPSSDNEKDELRAVSIFASDDIPKVSNPKNPPVQTGLSAIPKIRVQTMRRMN